MLGNFSYSNPTTKMKKLVVLLLAFVLCVSLGACGSRQKAETTASVKVNLRRPFPRQ